jgi:hypothetical protein
VLKNPITALWRLSIQGQVSSLGAVRGWPGTAPWPRRLSIQGQVSSLGPG